jgi:hypothetical protein
LIEPASSESENSFEVYPVPVKDILYYSLNTNNDIGSYITIRNVAGEKICTTYLKAGELKGELDVHQLEGGIYIVELKNGTTCLPFQSLFCSQKIHGCVDQVIDAAFFSLNWPSSLNNLS